MQELNELLRPSWGAEKWILEGWNTLTEDEKQIVTERMEALFHDGLPFQLKSDKLFYIYTFSLLAQLEVLAIQIPLKFESRMQSSEYQQRLRQQLLDEIFHGLVFTKIVYLLCAPYAIPPEYNSNIEILCNFIRNEECPKTALTLLNLIGEGWIEEIFYSLNRHDIAPKVFAIILEDEHRHVCEADLYREIGMPEIKQLKPKIEFLEEQLITNIFMQHKYVASVSALLGANGADDFIMSLDRKHRQQLAKINLSPTDKWTYFIRFRNTIVSKFKRYTESHWELEMSPIRKVFMTQWSNPSDPTMVAQFDMNVSCLDFFNKQFPKETVTCLMTQAISAGLASTDSFRNYLNCRKLFQSKDAYVGLVVKLPGCGDHIGTIVFENCHLISLKELGQKIKTRLSMMVYCYQKRAYLEKTNAWVKDIMQEMMYDFDYSTYPTPTAGTPFVSLSNIGYCGYSQCKSPLRHNEAMKFTLMEIQRKPVWNDTTASFEAQDMLPVSISADHRIFDGNLPVPGIVAKSFQDMFQKMLAEMQTTYQNPTQDNSIESILDELIKNNIELGYKALLMLQTYWFDFIPLEEMITQNTELVC